MTVTRYISVEESLLVGYLLGLAVYALILDTGESVTWDEQDVTLSEAHLQRLEDGDRVRIHRWHGHAVDLEGSLVVDTDELDADTDTGA